MKQAETENHLIERFQAFLKAKISLENTQESALARDLRAAFTLKPGLEDRGSAVDNCYHPPYNPSWSAEQPGLTWPAPSAPPKPPTSTMFRNHRNGNGYTQTVQNQDDKAKLSSCSIS